MGRPKKNDTVETVDNFEVEDMVYLYNNDFRLMYIGPVSQDNMICPTQGKLMAKKKFNELLEMYPGIYSFISTEKLLVLDPEKDIEFIKTKNDNFERLMNTPCEKQKPSERDLGVFARHYKHYRESV